jgi:hypothetical protein
MNTVDARATWLGYPTPTLTKTGVMSQITGYDGSQLLPPFLPVLRGEDSLFAYMLIAMHPDGLVLNHDWAAPHLPLETRSSRGLKGHIPAKGGLSLLTRWIGDNIGASSERDPKSRLQRLAESIESLTELSQNGLLALGRSELAKAHASQLATYEQQLGHSDSLESANWSQYLARGRDELLQAVSSRPDYDDILGVDPGSGGATIDSLRTAGRSFAEALHAWPDIWQAAQRLQDAP